MFRASRARAALIRSLLLGTATVSTTVVMSTALVGCKDENQPEYWLDKMEDAQWRPRAVKRLTQFLDDALSKANGDKNDPTVKELENKLIGPLVEGYQKNYAELDTATRVGLIRLLADFRDERAVPALKTAFDEFAKRPRKTKDEADIKWAIRAYGDMKSKELAPSVLAAFQKLEAHTALGGITYRDYSEGMVAAPDSGWTSELIGMLGVEIKNPASAKSKEQMRDMVEPFRDQQFWQVTAAQVLGEIGDPSAVEPLIKLILTPSKGDLAQTAILALVKIGKPSVDRAIKLLNESDPLVAYHKAEVKKATDAREEPKGNPALPMAAAIIGLTGRSEGIAPLIAALEGGKLEDSDKAVLARELTKIPATAASKEAFKKAFESIPLEANVGNETALVILAEAAGQFYDPEMVPWLLDRAENTKGGGEEKTALQQALVMTALKVSTTKTWAEVSAAAKKYKMDDLVKGAESVVKECGDKVACYLDAIEKSQNQDEKNQLAAIKAGYMIAVLGNAQSRDSLIERLGSIDNAAVRFVAAQAIDHLTPKGDKSVQDALNAIITKNKKSPDAAKAAGDSPLKQVSYRLAARGN
jgi:PBS lyase HEAT-like repeat